MAYVKFCDDNIRFRKSCFPLITLVFNEFVYSEPYLTGPLVEPLKPLETFNLVAIL